MKTAIEIYIFKSQNYVEYMHWNNNGALGGFIDDRKNMCILKEDYNGRNQSVTNCLPNRRLMT